eukprot:6031489-Amphidinium_carterae.2
MTMLANVVNMHFVKTLSHINIWCNAYLLVKLVGKERYGKELAQVQCRTCIKARGMAAWSEDKTRKHEGGCARVRRSLSLSISHVAPNSLAAPW